MVSSACSMADLAIMRTNEQSTRSSTHQLHHRFVDSCQQVKIHIAQIIDDADLEYTARFQRFPFHGEGSANHRGLAITSILLGTVVKRTSSGPCQSPHWSPRDSRVHVFSHIRQHRTIRLVVRSSSFHARHHAEPQYPRRGVVMDER